MGWSWALFFCNEVCAEAACESGPSFGGLVRHRQPVPPLSRDVALCSVYADNYVAIGGSLPVAEDSYDGFVAACDRRGLRLHECHRG
eukprot:5423473-Lingulodinium_polyedra.AAC.1